MDPTSNLLEQLALARDFIDFIDSDGVDYVGMVDKGVRLAELVQSLDSWIKNGGGLPQQWRDRP